MAASEKMELERSCLSSHRESIDSLALCQVLLDGPLVLWEVPSNDRQVKARKDARIRLPLEKKLKGLYDQLFRSNLARGELLVVRLADRHLMVCLATILHRDEKCGLVLLFHCNHDNLE